MKKETIFLELMNHGKVPVYANHNDAGADVFASEDFVLCPGETKVLPLKIKVALPDHLEMQVRPRSGLSLKTSLRIPNSPGTVDAGYRDEVGIILENSYNLSALPYEMLRDPSLMNTIKEEYEILFPVDKEAVFTAYKGEHYETTQLLNLSPFLILDENHHPYGTIYIEKGMKIAQVVFNEVIKGEFEEIEDVTTKGTNRGGGYGSTGLK
ncbi:aminotransferase [Proteiniclasticum sp.]|uniref:dUTP diphosphatase n=1 Tax=Proteiniclasticum sp. TaxID=2053595 RepID=UPI0028A06C93|nr:aminotransferase [Proteiniclasticum sp.]